MTTRNFMVSIKFCVLIRFLGYDNHLTMRWWKILFCSSIEGYDLMLKIIVTKSYKNTPLIVLKDSINQLKSNMYSHSQRVR